MFAGRVYSPVVLHSCVTVYAASSSVLLLLIVNGATAPTGATSTSSSSLSWKVNVTSIGLVVSLGFTLFKVTFLTVISEPL